MHSESPQISWSMDVWSPHWEFCWGGGSISQNHPSLLVTRVYICCFCSPLWWPEMWFLLWFPQAIRVASISVSTPTSQWAGPIQESSACQALTWAQLSGLVAEECEGDLQDEGTRTQNSQSSPGCYFGFPYKTDHLTIKPLAPGCSPWLVAVGWKPLLCNLGRNVILKEKPLSLRGRGRLSEVMTVSLKASGCCIKIAQTWAGTCVFRAQSHDYLNYYFFLGWFSILLLGRFLLIALTWRVQFSRH